MAHFALMAPALAGHINPLLVLARELISRGHSATFLHQPDAARFITDPSIGFVPVGTRTHPPGSLDAAIARMARLGVLAGVPAMIRDVAATTDMLCREAPVALRALKPDAIIADQMEAAGGLVARHLGLSFVTIAAGLPINRERSLPPPYVPWGFHTTLPWRRLNIGGWRVTDLLMRDLNRVIEHWSRAFSIERHRRTEDAFSPLAQLAQCVPGLDFPRRELPDSFHYLGPFRDDNEPFELADDGRPLVYCSLGTIQGARNAIFDAVTAACRDLGLQLVIAHGGRMAPEAAAALPGRPIVRDFVPQRAVLARAALAVTHAGFNTVLDALSCGVPMVVLPLAFEQPATAARLVRAGAAKALYGRCTPARLRQAIGHVLSAPHFRANARTLAAEISLSGGVMCAADITEDVLGLRPPTDVGNSTGTMVRARRHL